ncbi:ABC transporter permease subunit, partial [Bacillus pumilus]
MTSVISGALPAALDIVAGEKDRKSIEALFLTPASRLQILIGKWLAVSMFGILSGIVAIGMLLLSTLLFTEKLKQALNFGDQMWSIIAVMFAALIIFYFMVSMIELQLSVVSRLSIIQKSDPTTTSTCCGFASYACINGGG